MESLPTIVPAAPADDQPAASAAVHTLAGTHRRIVADDLAALGDRAADILDATGARPGEPLWEVLRNAHDTCLALAELLTASDGETRDLAALGEHTLLVLGTAIEAATPAPAEPLDLDTRIIAAIFELPQTTAQIGEVLDVDGETLEAALQRLADAGRLGVTKITGQTGTRWVASA